MKEGQEVSGGEPSLGNCCGCATFEGVRNICLLPKKAPTKEGGWGCVVCGLPNNGAVAVLCDDCLEKSRTDQGVIKFACEGFPAANVRVPVGLLSEPHKHDMGRHRESGFAA